MLVIVLASQKGGVGKTTICGHLAVEAERQGAGPVALLDTDPQGGLAAWWNTREATTPAFVQLAAGGLDPTLAELEAQGCGALFIDTPPALTDAIRATVARASLVLVPVQPSPHDLRAVATTMDLVRAAGRPMVFVLNRTRAGNSTDGGRGSGAVAARDRSAGLPDRQAGLPSQHDRRPYCRRGRSRIKIRR